ncbi:hypothetical protein K501DRAFT_312685 [Backusella circina FSU 941]|nr:hypothetical protein K501DRAFT_312685 [Backusella circina FSU 941]
MMGWYHRLLQPKSNSNDLQRYVHPTDGSLCQTLFTPRRFQHSPFTCHASLLLVNNWYRPSKAASTLHQFHEKAMGKLHIECLYLPRVSGDVPLELDKTVQDLNSMRFHQTLWQSGYMSQLGGNTKYIKQRFFTLRGGCLYASEEENTDPLFYIDLSRVVNVISDEESMKGWRGGDAVVKYGFRLVFDNHDAIQFSCNSLEECKKWLSLIQVMITNVPIMPHWKDIRI